MNRKYSCLLAITATLPLCGSPTALFYSPAPDAPLAFEADLSSSELESALPMADPPGWNTIEWDGPHTGYIIDAEMAKDMLPQEGALVRLHPDDASPILTIAEAGDSFEVTDSGSWWTVEFTKPVPMYFTPQEAEAPPALQLLDPPVEETWAPQPLAAMPAAVAPATRPAATTATGGRESAARDIAQPFEGTFRRTSKRLLFFAEPYRYGLYKANGDLAAYVDISQLIIPGSFKQYLDRSVIIHGISRPMEGNPNKIRIEARNMRLK